MPGLCFPSHAPLFHLAKRLWQDPPLGRSYSTWYSEPSTVGAVCPKQGRVHGVNTQGACCSGTWTFLWILFHMVGNFKEICPNFIILIFSILDIPKGTVQALSGPILQWQEGQGRVRFQKGELLTAVSWGLCHCSVKHLWVGTMKDLGTWVQLHHRTWQNWFGGSGPAGCMQLVFAG